MTEYTMVPTKTYPISEPTGPEMDKALPLPIKSPVPMVPPNLQVSWVQLEGYKICIPMAIIWRCRLFRFLLSSVASPTSCFSSSLCVLGDVGVVADEGSSMNPFLLAS